MAFLKKLFGKNKPPSNLNDQINLTLEEFLGTDQIKELSKK